MERINLTEAEEWIESVADILEPDDIHICDGSDDEYQRLVSLLIEHEELIKLNPKSYPNCYLYRSDPKDVARTEKATYICAKSKDAVGPLNNFLHVDEARDKVMPILKGALAGKTMYVVPYIMGPADSPYSDVGIEITDSEYVVLNMKIMTRMGKIALERIEKDGRFVKGIHVSGSLDPENKYILHFPWERTILDAHIVSVNSAYGGNALLSKKCHALRIASVKAREEGWMAEHMLILEVENPAGKKYYFAAAFPSASGKTNLAMINPPKEYAEKGWKARLIGDDIAWIHVGKDGRLYALNPENGFFGVVPGTNYDSNPNAMSAIYKDTIFTNVGLTEDMEPWWEGLSVPRGKKIFDWRGNEFNPASGNKAAHPNSRFTTPLKNYPHLSPECENPEGVPLTAILFGGRREHVIPLVFEAFDWNHGVFLGSTMGVEQTAAAEGKVGEIRRDPMAMRPFCGYNVNEYFRHWIKIGKVARHPPGIFYVNWFRKDENGKFIWPGFGQNMRVIKWIIDKVEGRAKGRKTPIGYIPRLDELDTNGIAISSEGVSKLLSFNGDEWRKEVADMKKYIDSISPGYPDELLKIFSDLQGSL